MSYEYFCDAHLSTAEAANLADHLVGHGYLRTDGDQTHRMSFRLAGYPKRETWTEDFEVLVGEHVTVVAYGGTRDEQRRFLDSVSMFLSRKGHPSEFTEE